MSEPSKTKPILIVETEAALATQKVATAYQVVPLSGYKSVKYADTTVILWPDATPESREAFRKAGEVINKSAAELKIIIPNGRAHGWNIAKALSEGMTWAELTAWARVSMMVFKQGEFPVVQTEEAPDPVSQTTKELWESLGLALNHASQPILNVDNVVRALANHQDFCNIIWFDDFYQRYFTTWNGPVREWQDIDDINFTVILQREFGLSRLSIDTVSAAIRCRGHQCQRNAPKDWINGLKWDGKDRLDRFFADYLGAEFTGYTAAVSRNFWVGMIARVYSPGCQVDNMVILEGKQGIFKSKALEAIGGPWYMEAAEEITSKDFFVALSGKLIVEIADLDSFSRADTNRIKKVITCRVDRYRAPYGRASQDHPRCSVFVGTTNERSYLRDNTGARRFWPITCGRIDLDAIRHDREQLFAESRTRYLAGEDWYRVPEDQTTEQQEERREYDEWENVIHEYTIGKNEITLIDLAGYIGMDKSEIDLPTQRRIGKILRYLKWERKTVRRGLTTLKVWIPAETDQPPTPEPNESALVTA